MQILNVPFVFYNMKIISLNFAMHSEITGQRLRAYADSGGPVKPTQSRSDQGLHRPVTESLYTTCTKCTKGAQKHAVRMHFFYWRGPTVNVIWIKHHQICCYLNWWLDKLRFPNLMITCSPNAYLRKYSSFSFACLISVTQSVRYN